MFNNRNVKLIVALLALTMIAALPGCTSKKDKERESADRLFQLGLLILASYVNEYPANMDAVMKGISDDSVYTDWRKKKASLKSIRTDPFTGSDYCYLGPDLPSQWDVGWDETCILVHEDPKDHDTVRFYCIREGVRVCTQEEFQDKLKKTRKVIEGIKAAKNK